MGSKGFVLACGGIPAVIRQSPRGAGFRPVGPPAPILTNSGHPPRDVCFLANRVATAVYPVFFWGGKNAMPAQWRKHGALEVVENGLENE